MKRWLIHVAIIILTLWIVCGISGSATPHESESDGKNHSTVKKPGISGQRVPIPPSCTPAEPFTIERPGSYYLTGDRLCRENGIEVKADHVTIDLMGFSLAGSASKDSVGIRMESCRDVEIRNGTVRNFGARGIHDKAENERACGKRIIGVRVYSNGSCGVCIGGTGNLVKDCTLAWNKGTGVCGGKSAMLIGNVAFDNETGGLSAGDGSTISGNAAFNNKRTGIFAKSGCTITNNTSYNNHYSGIFAESGSRVTRNTVYRNNRSNTPDYYAGIRVKRGCVVQGNTARSNLQNNIYVKGAGNVVEKNLVTYEEDDEDPGNGIYFGTNDNFYADNKALGNKKSFAGDLPVGKGDGGGNVALE